VLTTLQPKPLRTLSPPPRPSIHDEVQRLKASYTRGELRRLCEMIGVEAPKAVTKVVERYIRGVPEKTTE
jgi:hypothetical protein